MKKYDLKSSNIIFSNIFTYLLRWSIDFLGFTLWAELGYLIFYIVRIHLTLK